MVFFHFQDFSGIGDKEINVCICRLKIVLGLVGYHPRERPEEQKMSFFCESWYG